MAAPEHHLPEAVDVRDPPHVPPAPQLRRFLPEGFKTPKPERSRGGPTTTPLLPDPLTDKAPGLVARTWGRLHAFLVAHPVVCLLLLAPEVEYLTGSTQLSLLVGNPLAFFLFLAQNLGSYGAAVLLIREAKVRWNLGWASVLLLGAAYGIVNEGLGAGTLFNPATVGAAGLGAYGHWMGVNWVNVAILVPFVHPLYSVSLPILFFDLARPATRGQPLLTRGEIRLAFLVLGTDTLATSFFLVTFHEHVFAGFLLLGACLLAIPLLVLAARFVPHDLLRPRLPHPSASPQSFAILGAALPWAVFLGGALLASGHAPAALVMLEVVGGAGLALLWVQRHVGQRENALQLVALGGGLVAGLIPMGISTQFATGVAFVPVLAGDLLAVLFVRFLWHRYSTSSSSPDGSGVTRMRPSSGLEGVW